MWQDYVMSFASILFGYSLIPQVIKCFNDKYVQIPMQTILFTWTGLVLYNICSYTLKLYISVGIGVITTSCWTVLGLLKWIYSEQRKTTKIEEQSLTENNRGLRKFECNGHIYWIRPVSPNSDTNF